MDTEYLRRFDEISTIDDVELMGKAREYVISATFPRLRSLLY